MCPLKASSIYSTILNKRLKAYYVPPTGDEEVEETRPLPSRAPSILGRGAAGGKRPGKYKMVSHCWDGEAQDLWNQIRGVQEDFLEEAGLKDGSEKVRETG